MDTGRRDHDLVTAARCGDQQAQDDLIAAYLPLVYNIVGRALNGHADADDVVQETMLRALRGLGSLDDPANFRSWLVAIAMNQIRNHWHVRNAAPTAPGLQDGYDVADPGADFVDLTIVRLGLAGQRREVAEATRWLDDDDRALLSLWWLEAAGELSRAEVAAAMALSPQHTAVRVQRMKTQLETARLIVRALTAVPRCAFLDQVTGVWDGSPSALWRKRIARHVRECADCARYEAGLVPAEGLLVGLGLVPVAAGLLGAAAIGFAGAGAGAGADGGAEFGLAGHHGGGGHGEAMGFADPGFGAGSDAYGSDSGAGAGAYGSDSHTASDAYGAPGDGTGVVGTVGGGRVEARRTRRIRRRRATVGAVAAALLVTGGTVAGIAVLSPDKPEDGDNVRSASTPGSPLPSSSAASPSASPSNSPSTKPSPSRTKASASAKPKPKPTTPKPKPTTQRPAPTADPADTPGAQVLALVNAERGKAGCKPVKYDSRLARAAQLHSEDMSANNYFDHTSQDGRTFADRAKAQGYDNPGAENIARGQNSAESVMDAWMNSQGHRENILNCGLTTMGLGVVTKDWTWTQVFGW